MNYEELRAIVYGRNPNDLIGLIEGQHFDAKSSPYIFNKESVKHEYAKDIVSFLNADGGFILLGGSTQINSSHSGEEVSEISWFPNELFSLQQYRTLIAEWIYPEPEGVDFCIISGADTYDGKMICIINIPKQNISNKPYLIAKSILEEGGKTDIQIIGYAKRVFDGTRRVQKKELHKWIQSGQLFEDRIMARFDYLSNLVEERGSAASTLPSQVEEHLPARIDSAVAHLNATNDRVFCLAIYPCETLTIPKIFESRRSPVANLMTDPPVLRQSGWDVQCGLNPRITNGNFLRNGESDRRVLDVYADGTTIFVAMINQDLLAWNSKSGTRLHPLALSESIWGVCAFFKGLASHFDRVPEKVAFHLELRNMQLNGEPTSLPPHQIGSFSFQFGTDDHEATEDLCFAKNAILWSDYTPEVVAYDVVRSIYIWFEFTEADIPYVAVSGGRKALDTVAMIKPVQQR